MYTRKELYTDAVFNDGTAMFHRIIGRMTKELKTLCTMTIHQGGDEANRVWEEKSSWSGLTCSVRFRSCSSSLRSSTSLSWRRVRSPWSRLFRRLRRFSSCNSSTRWSMPLLCWSWRFQVTGAGRGENRCDPKGPDGPGRTCPPGGTGGNCGGLEITAPLTVESTLPKFVTAPVLEASPVVVESVQPAPVRSTWCPQHFYRLENSAKVMYIPMNGTVVNNHVL